MKHGRTLRNGLAGVALLALVGCDEHHDGDETSTVTGALAAGAARFSTIVIAARSGDATTTEVAGDGGFRLELAGDETYRFFVVSGGERLPLILRADGGLLGAELFVASGGASVDVGQVHLRPGRVSALHGELAGDDAGTCPDGTVAGGAPCIEDTAEVMCRRGKHHHGDGDDDGDEHDDGEQVGEREEGEHDGAGEPGAAPADLATVSATEASAIVELALPAAIGCKKRHHRGGHDE